MKSLPSLTHFLANWMITISDFFPSVFHSFFTSEENVFFTSEGNFVYPTISPCTIHLSVFFYDTQCKTCSTTKNFVAVNKKNKSLIHDFTVSSCLNFYYHDYFDLFYL